MHLLSMYELRLRVPMPFQKTLYTSDPVHHFVDPPVTHMCQQTMSQSLLAMRQLLEPVQHRADDEHHHLPIRERLIFWPLLHIRVQQKIVGDQHRFACASYTSRRVQRRL